MAAARIAAAQRIPVVTFSLLQLFIRCFRCLIKPIV